MSSHADIGRNDIITPRTGEDGPVILSPALYDRFHDMYVALLAENERLRLERDDFEQRLHAYKQGEIV
jgi:hypothetical protein